MAGQRRDTSCATRAGMSRSAALHGPSDRRPAMRERRKPCSRSTGLSEHLPSAWRAASSIRRPQRSPVRTSALQRNPGRPARGDEPDPQRSCFTCSITAFSGEWRRTDGSVAVREGVRRRVSTQSDTQPCWLSSLSADTCRLAAGPRLRGLSCSNGRPGNVQGPPRASVFVVRYSATASLRTKRADLARYASFAIA